MRRMLAVLLLTTVVGVLTYLPNPAGAQAYSGCAAQLSDVTVAPGDTITVNGTNAQPGEDVVASIEGQVIGQAAATANGDFSFRATVPGDLAPGTYSVQVSCGPQGAVLSLTITVGSPAGTGGGGSLPHTGSGGVQPLSQIAIGLIAIGGLFGLTSRSRRRTRTRPEKISA